MEWFPRVDWSTTHCEHAMMGQPLVIPSIEIIESITGKVMKDSYRSTRLVRDAISDGMVPES